MCKTLIVDETVTQRSYPGHCCVSSLLLFIYHLWQKPYYFAVGIPALWLRGELWLGEVSHRYTSKAHGHQCQNVPKTLSTSSCFRYIVKCEGTISLRVQVSDFSAVIHPTQIRIQSPSDKFESCDFLPVVEQRTDAWYLSQTLYSHWKSKSAAND